MLADLIREFCKEPEYNYEVYENYTKTFSTPTGDVTVTTLGIVVNKDQNYFEVMAQLARYCDAKGFTDPLMEFEGTGIGDLGQNKVIVYFPAIRDYHPLQP